jgi:molybdopterin synthase sulfur carrier subunit
MTITVQLFAILKDLVGTSQISLECPIRATVADVAAQLLNVFPQLAPSLPKIAYAVDEQFVSPQTVLQDGQVLALIPPVSGG